MAKYDFMAFGEPNIRLSPPGHDRLGQAEELQLGIAAAELNCCVNIANLSVEKLLPTVKTAYITKLVDNWTGSYIVKHAQMHGVDMSNIVVEPFDRVGRVRNGLAFVEVGIGPRPSYQIYDRGHSALSYIQPGDIDWEQTLDTRWFHTTGIVAALGEHTAGETLAALKAAKKNGAVTSFDVNFRPTLWSAEEAARTLREFLPHIDVLFAGGAEVSLLLGEPETGPYPYTADGFRAAAERIMAAYPNLRAVSSTYRRVPSALLNDWQGWLMTRKGFFCSRLYENIEIYDRVGAGDAYGSAIIWSLLEGRDEQDAVDLAAAYSALCHTIRNDWNLVTRAEAEALAAGGSARVKR